jgi:hypothetical protein
MALTAGNVSVSDDGSEVKAGAAGRLYDALMADFDLAMATVVDDPVGTVATVRIAAQKGQAKIANVIGQWMVAEITTYATAKITTAQAGLQRLPAVTTEDTECKAPVADKFLVIV